MLTQTLVAPALLGSLLLGASQLQALSQDPPTPVPEATPETEPAAEPEEAVEVPVDWARFQRLVGGEWHAGAEFPVKNFHRFISRVDGRAVRIETRSMDALDNPLKSHGMFFWHPKEQSIRGLAIAEGGTLFDGRLHFEEERLIDDFRYVVGGRVMEFVEHWDFEEGGYHWELLQKTTTGVASVMKTSFTHQAEETPLPEILVQPHALAEPLAALEPLLGEWTTAAPDGDGVLHSQRTVCAAGYGIRLETAQVTKDGASTDALSGMVFWDADSKCIRFVDVARWDAIYEGELRVSESGGLSLHYHEHKAEGSTPYTEHLRFEDGTLHSRVWQGTTAEGEPAMLMVHERLR